MSDLTYTQNELFARFYPETEAGAYVWRKMAKTLEMDCVTVPNNHLESIIRQIREAGYTVEKAKSVTKADFDKIMKELGELKCQ